MFKLEGELSIYRAAELLPQLLAAVAAAGPTLELDLDAVTELDTAGVQLLLVTRRAALARAQRLVLRVPAAGAVRDTLTLLGLEHQFGLTARECA